MLHPGPAEVIELALVHACEESVPFVRSEAENRPFAFAGIEFVKV